MQIILIIERLQIYFQIDKKKDLAEKLGVKPSVISNWLNRNTIDWDIVFTKCENLNFDWLIRGTGEMMLNDVNKDSVVQEPASNYASKNLTKAELIDALEKAIKSLKSEL